MKTIVRFRLKDAKPGDIVYHYYGSYKDYRISGVVLSNDLKTYNKL